MFMYNDTMQNSTEFFFATNVTSNMTVEVSTTIPSCNEFGRYGWYIYTPDWMVTFWSASMFLFTVTPIYYLFLKSNPFSKSNNNNADLNDGNKILWRLGFCACIFYYLREFADVLCWVTYIIQLNDCQLSPSWYFDTINEFCNILNDTLLYQFFIYRLYMVHGKYSTNNIYNQRVYYFLLTINFVNFLALGVEWYALTFVSTTFSFLSNNSDITLYIICEAVSLFCEIILVCTITKLFLNPLIIMSAQKAYLHGSSVIHARGSNGVNINIDSEKSNDFSVININSDSKINSDINGNNSKRKAYVGKDVYKCSPDDIANELPLVLSTKFLILSVFALGSSVVCDLISIAAYHYCLDCWLKYLSWGTWTIDASINILCITCAFKTGNKYYEKICVRCINIHEYVLQKVIGNAVNKKVDQYVRVVDSDMNNL